MPHTFFVHFFAVVLHDYNVKLPETPLLQAGFLEEVSLSFSPCIGGRRGWPLAFLSLSPPLQSFHVVLPTKKMSPLFFFSRWASLACRLLSLFLCLSLALYSKFVGVTINLLSTTDTQIISAFRFRLYWLFSCLCFIRRRWLKSMRFPAKINSSCSWVAIPSDWVILHWYACGADGR